MSESQIVQTAEYVDVDATMRLISKKRFKEWNVSELMYCPQPKVYDGARRQLAERMFPYFIELLQEMAKHDIDIEKDRVTFFMDTLNKEVSHLIDKAPLEEATKNVLIAYIAAINDMKDKIFGEEVIGHDVLVSFAAAIELQKDILDMCGIKIKPLAPGSPHPLSHRVPALPGVT